MKMNEGLRLMGLHPSIYLDIARFLYRLIGSLNFSLQLSGLRL